MAKWLEKTLGEVTAFIAKGIPPKYTEKESEKTIRVLNQKCNRNFEISYNESRIHDCEKKKVPVDKILRAGDVLINSTGTGTAGRVAQMVEVTVPTTIDGHMILIRPSEELDPIYYGYAVKSFQSQIEGLAEGSTGQTEINRRRLQDEVIIRYPSDKLVQKNIGRFLANIDEKIKTNKEINRNLSEQASAYYENWKMSLIGEAVELSKVIDVRDGTHASPKPQDEGYPLVTSKHLFEYDVDLESPNKISQDDYDKTNERSKVEYHDVLMSMIGTVGVVSFISRQEINFAIKNVALFRTSQREELAYYVLLFLKSKDTKQYIKSCMAGSTQQYISLTELRKIPIIVPGEEIKEFNLVIKPIIDMICANVIENRRLSELRDTLLPKLMSGELDVSDLDI